MSENFRESISGGFAGNIIELKLASNRLVEGKGAGLFSIKYQILYVISSRGRTSPAELIYELNMAKSNLAILAKKMISEGLIISVKTPDNKKQIYYQITEKGKAQLFEKMNTIDSHYSADSQMLKRLSKMVESLKKIK